MADYKNAYLKHVEVYGFKSIKELNLEMAPINLLIGANGSGKSNFISLFTFFQSLSQGKLQNYVEKNGYAAAFFHFGPKITPQIEIDIAFGNNSYHVTFDHSANDDSLVFGSEYCTYVESKKQFSVKGLRGESGLIEHAEADSVFVRDYTRKYLKECRVYHFHDTGETAAYKRAIDVSAADFLYTDAGNIAAFLYRLKSSDDAAYRNSYSEIVDAVKTVSPYFHDFYLEPVNHPKRNSASLLLKWLHRDHDEPFSANQLSDGSARFICMATLFLQPAELRPELIILDEPELGLHPAALEVLADIVKVKSRESQVICSTQSVVFANQFQASDFIVVDLKRGVSSFNRVEEEELKEWLQEYAMGDIWAKNLIGGRPEW